MDELRLPSVLERSQRVLVSGAGGGFDVYAGKGMPEGMRSLAFRVTYRSAGRTLTDEEVAAMHERVRELMVSRFGAQLR